MESNIYKIGVDVGGTNTDAVILDQHDQVLSAVKSPTTSDVQSGIFNSIKKVLELSQINVKDVAYVSLGTTHATNAIIRRKDLSKVAVVRICLPAGKGVAPMAGWDESLIHAMNAKSFLIHGGFEYDGRPLSGELLDEEECKNILSDVKVSGYNAIAVSSIFSPAKDLHEKEFAKLAHEYLGEDFPVTLSSEIGSLGLLERENSAILNASVVAVAKKAANGLVEALKQLGITGKVFFAQNDGTLMALEHAIKYPVLTIGSGPTNSTRGAAYLSNLKNCIVADIGGTSTDVGILVNGFPRQSALAVEVGGVLTNFRMPDLISIGLGGGSIVTFEGDDIQIGPDSVGYQIKEKAISFGGDVLTTTDIAIASGVAQIDDPDCDPTRLQSLDPDLVQRAMEKIQQMVMDTCEKIKTSPEPLPIVLVGGGSVIMPTDTNGSVDLIKPEHFGCANALGAAIADASGEVDGLWPMEDTSRDEVIQKAKVRAIEKAISMGAKEDSTEIVDLEAVPLSYLPGNVLRVKAKAAGPLQL
ncbi:hydantoinase/oxoprolinase family protein [Bacillus sp. 522_BSPC]|uniref:hydantoinase/oxoprolinase family protein n=1 Tax=Bacillus sp. 522_BSPC TaxID=1579338 RepID=UPI00065F83F3|nr:hydantoinase/oxoprolinase family protein [Bacillus sp. 522_BSPC]REB73249.1 hydantoinase subunit beta [Cutibacterium acnes]